MFHLRTTPRDQQTDKDGNGPHHTFCSFLSELSVPPWPTGTETGVKVKYLQGEHKSRGTKGLDAHEKQSFVFGSANRVPPVGGPIFLLYHPLLVDS